MQTEMNRAQQNHLGSFKAIWVCGDGEGPDVGGRKLFLAFRKVGSWFWKTLSLLCTGAEYPFLLNGRDFVSLLPQHHTQLMTRLSVGKGSCQPHFGGFAWWHMHPSSPVRNLRAASSASTVPCLAIRELFKLFGRKGWFPNWSFDW
jgi:hypothetical protein